MVVCDLPMVETGVRFPLLAPFVVGSLIYICMARDHRSVLKYSVNFFLIA